MKFQILKFNWVIRYTTEANAGFGNADYSRLQFCSSFCFPETAAEELIVENFISNAAPDSQDLIKCFFRCTVESFR